MHIQLSLPLSLTFSPLPRRPFSQTRSASTTPGKPQSSTASTSGRRSRPRPRSGATSSASSHRRQAHRRNRRQTELLRASSSRSGTWADRPISAPPGQLIINRPTQPSWSSTAPTGPASASREGSWSPCSPTTTSPTPLSWSSPTSRTPATRCAPRSLPRPWPCTGSSGTTGTCRGAAR